MVMNKYIKDAFKRIIMCMYLCINVLYIISIHIIYIYMHVPGFNHGYRKYGYENQFEEDM